MCVRLQTEDVVTRAQERWTVPIHTLVVVCLLATGVALPTKLQLLFQMMGPSPNAVVQQAQVPPRVLLA